MTPVFPVIELFDRLAIAEIKWNRTRANGEELSWYKAQAAFYNFSLIESLFEELKKNHDQIWELEWQLKLGVEDQLSLEEIGRRAIAVRNLNKKRIQIKNQMADVLNSPVKEVKQDHLSQ